MAEPLKGAALQIARLQAEYQAHLPVELSSLKNLAQDWHQVPGAHEQLIVLHRRLHSLAGSAGTFGVPELGAKARLLEQRLQEWLRDSSLASEAEVREAFIAELSALPDLLPGGRA